MRLVVVEGGAGISAVAAVVVVGGGGVGDGVSIGWVGCGVVSSDVGGISVVVVVDCCSCPDW